MHHNVAPNRSFQTVVHQPRRAYRLIGSAAGLEYQGVSLKESHFGSKLWQQLASGVRGGDKAEGQQPWLSQSQVDAFQAENSGSQPSLAQSSLAAVQETIVDKFKGFNWQTSPSNSGIDTGQVSSHAEGSHFGLQGLQQMFEGIFRWEKDKLTFPLRGNEPIGLSEPLQTTLNVPAAETSHQHGILMTSLDGIGEFLGRESSGVVDTFARLQAEADSHISAAGISGHSWSTLLPLAAAVAFSVYISTPRSSETASAADAPPSLTYSIQDAAAYWDQRPVAVGRRLAIVAFEAARWGIGFAFDKARGKVRENASKRAIALRGVLERLGPAYVKIAQAVSTRVDLVDAEYLLEIERLQDRVPPFPTPVAEETMARSLGRPSNAVFDRLSREPVAAASLGQVYRGRLRPELGGHEVAVKVQRPGVLKAVALDLYLMRRLAVQLDKFYHELDYLREARNAMVFKEQMKALDGITVPYVFQDLCSQEVLTTAWVKGVKLSESNASDVRELCTTLLNCYLIQLLETGSLHADPHPGNLLRTPDGKICILDFGLMTEISQERRIALVEYIAHLTSEDFDSIPGDLYKLGFIPEGAPRPEESGLVQPLSRILRQLSQGGGARAINIEEVFEEMEDLTRRYPFQIPSYFALILRAFSVIEGIALRVDPTYAIVPECFPYVSRRLFTDNSPRIRSALQQMLYGKRKRLDIGRLRRLASGFGNFTVGGLSSNTALVPQGEQRILDATTIDALRTLFKEEGSFIQEVAVAETVAAVDAVGREIGSRVTSNLLGTVPAVASLSLIRGLGPLRLVVFPLPTPVEALTSLASTIEPTSEDQEALFVAQNIWEMLQQNPSQAGTQPGKNGLVVAFQLARELQPLLPELLPGILATAQLFVRSLVQRVAIRVSEEAARRPGMPESAVSFPPQQAFAGDLVTTSPLWLILPGGLLQWPHTTVNRNQPL